MERAGQESERRRGSVFFPRSDALVGVVVFFCVAADARTRRPLGCDVFGLGELWPRCAVMGELLRWTVGRIGFICIPGTDSISFDAHNVAKWYQDPLVPLVLLAPEAPTGSVDS